MPLFNVSREARWASCCILAAIALGGICCFINYRIDLYGLFGATSDHDRLIYQNEKPDKYLLSLRYIPEHFDALLVGSSVTDNWDTSRIKSVQMYNGSISGGTISEAKIIADNVMHRRKLRVIVFCVYPYLTASHRTDPGMVPRAFWGALGSWQLFRDYSQAFLISHGRIRQKFTGYGVFKFDIDAADQHAWEQGRFVPETLEIDPLAWAQYVELINEARAQEATIIRLDPPIAERMWGQQATGYQAYYARMGKLFRPDDPVINFNKGEFDELRNRQDAYYDGAHLTEQAATMVMASLKHDIDSLVQGHIIDYGK